MLKRAASQDREGLKAARLLMVLSSFTPLFVLWAIRGNKLIPDHLFIALCAVMIVLPNAFLWLRIRTAKKQQDKREISVGEANDHRDHILVYLFAMLLPFYSEDLGTWRNLGSVLVALGFIVFLFWHLNLHYMNLVFAVFRYRVFAVHPPVDGNSHAGRGTQVLITRRVHLARGERIVAYRLSNSVYLEIV